MKFRKKPIVIDARNFVSAAIGPSIAEWCGGRLIPPVATGEPTTTKIGIDTLEGTMYADLGDWIICGVAGEFYPCKPDIFVATYEPAT